GMIERFGGMEQLYFQVGYFVDTPEAREAAARGLVLEALHRLEEELSRSGTFRDVRIGPRSDDEQFLREEVLPQAPFLLAAEDFEVFLGQISEPSALAERAAVLKRQISGPSAGLQSFLRADPLGLAPELLERAGEGLPSDPWTGAFVADSGLVGLAIATPDLTDLRPPELLAEVEELAARIRSEVDPGGQLELRPIGGALYAAWDETALRSDLTITLTVSLALSLLALALGLRSAWIPVVAGLTLALAALVTLAWMVAFRGSIVALGFGFSAVLVGLGVDALIHGAGSWRRDGAADVVAAARDTGPGIVLALATSAVAFFGLSLASLRVVRDVGVFVGLGLVAVLLATLLVGVPTARWAETRRGQSSAARDRTLAPWLVAISEGVRRGAQSRPRLVLAAFGVIAALSWASARSAEVRADVASLRPATHPATQSERSLAQEFGLGADTLQFIVQGSSLGEALDLSARLAEGLRAQASSPSVQSPSDLLGTPARGDERRARLAALPLRELRETFEEALRREGLSPAAFEDALDGFEALGASGRDWDLRSLPSWLQRQISVDGSEVGLLVHARAESPEESLRLARLFRGPSVTPVSSAVLGAELERSVRADLRTLGVVSLASVLALLLLAFRGRLSLVLLALLPTLFGTAAALASLGLTGQPLDLLGVAMLPVLLGLGIDDGIHAVMHAGSRFGLGERIRRAGPAMTLTTLTTCVGFGSLMLSEIPSLARAGAFIALGVSCCWLTTMALLPALGALGGKRVAREGQVS
ncbi:MAG: MMPL family transporter, partial [Acidobacteriota bacterium]